jgi:hypothetical protein
VKIKVLCQCAIRSNLNPLIHVKAYQFPSVPTLKSCHIVFNFATMTTSATPGTSPSIAIRRMSRRVSATAWHDLQEPRPPGGWNTLERFTSSYTRSATFFPMDTTSPSSSFTPRRLVDEEDVGESAVADEDEETSLITPRVERYGILRRQSTQSFREESGDVEDHFAQFRVPKPSDDGYGSIVGISSRRASILTEHGGPELLIKQVEDEAGNIIEVVVGQVRSSISRLTLEYGGSDGVQFD